MEFNRGKFSAVMFSLIIVISGLIIRGLIGTTPIYDKDLPVNYDVYVAEESSVNIYKAYKVEKYGETDAVIILTTGTVVSITDADAIDVISVE